MNVEREKTTQKTIVEREQTKRKIIELILHNLEEEGKGNLTSIYAIGILKETMADIEANAMMCPLRHSLKLES